MVATIIVIGIVVALVVVFFMLYNTLVRLRNQVDEGWAQIDVQLKRRADLIPNLVETVKGYASHEKETLGAVTNARAALQGAGENPKAAAAADDMLSSALGRLFAVSEAYPDLKASTNFSQLQEELATTENKVAFARQYYNARVRELNTKVQTVPYNLVAGAAKATERDYFEVPENSAAREAPTVQF